MQGLGRKTQQGSFEGGVGGGSGGPQDGDGYGPAGSGDGMVSPCLHMQPSCPLSHVAPVNPV